MTGFVLQDASGVLWSVTMDGAGGFAAPVVVVGFPRSIIVLNDQFGHSWQIVVSTGGVLSTTAFSIPNCGTPKILMAAANSTYWYVSVDNTGAFIIVPAANITPDPVLGTLYPKSVGYPQFTQPGGPGTQTFPAQQTGGSGQTWIEGIPNEIGSGMWTLGCGHWFNSLNIVSSTVAGTTAALLLCPLCHFIGAIVIPYSLIQDPIANPIIFP